MCGEPHKSLPSGRDTRRKLSRPASRTSQHLHVYSSPLLSRLWPSSLRMSITLATHHRQKATSSERQRLQAVRWPPSQALKDKSTKQQHFDFREAHRQQSVATPTRPTRGRGAGKTTRWKISNAKKTVTVRVGGPRHARTRCLSVAVDGKIPLWPQLVFVASPTVSTQMSTQASTHKRTHVPALCE
jgi:hypothetical protein